VPTNALSAATLGFLVLVLATVDWLLSAFVVPGVVPAAGVGLGGRERLVAFFFPIKSENTIIGNRMQTYK